MVLQVLKNFAGKTSIHGLGFVVDYRLSVFTRVTWALIFLAAIIWASIQLQFSVTCKLSVKFLGKTLSCKSFLLASTGQSIQTKPNFFPIWPLASHSKFRVIYHMPHHVKKYTNAIRPISRCIWT